MNDVQAVKSILMTVQTAQWRDNSVASPIWASPTWPMLAAVAVLGCAGLGLAHKHGRMITHPQPAVAAQDSKAVAPSGGSLTQAAYAKPQALPATENQ